ncbi:ATP-binding cassette domain-containing protein [Chloroflexi bacterium TSY]|nr:ATP-binding cassette domain-containing protein [Chloroflexi bacterium TSY]
MLLSIDQISKTFGHQQVLDNVSLTIHVGQKIGLVGANGAGKSTLLKIIVGEVEPDSGTLSLTEGKQIGYLPQTLATAEKLTVAQLLDQPFNELKLIEQQMRSLESKMATDSHHLPEILAEYSQLAERFEQQNGYAIERLLEQVLTGLHVNHIERQRPISTLSGGEKTRVSLAALLLGQPDLLLLDEPTNHLDFIALEWLEGYLQSFSGAIFAVSHDRYFLNQTVASIVEVDEHSHQVKFYSGDYEFYAKAKADERVQWVERYWEQQEEIWQLRRIISGKARRVAHNRPPRDGDKMAYDHKGGRVQDTISRNVRAAEEKLRRIQAEPIPKPPSELTINPDFDPEFLANKLGWFILAG